MNLPRDWFVDPLTPSQSPQKRLRQPGRPPQDPVALRPRLGPRLPLVYMKNLAHPNIIVNNGFP